jgi:hypothetical protein
MYKKRIVIHQPDFMPYLGFFDRFRNADLYIALDSVQYVNSSRGWTNRDKVKSVNGEKWLSVSVEKTNRSTLINEVVISKNVDWKKNHLSIIRENYRSSPYYDEVIFYINNIYEREYKYLKDLNIDLIKFLMGSLNLEVPWIWSSDLKISGQKNELLINIIKSVNGNQYLSGVGAKEYLNEEAFRKAGIEVIWQDFKHPIYRQNYTGFIPYLSSIDMLLNCGFKNSQEIMGGM